MLVGHSFIFPLKTKEQVKCLGYLLIDLGKLVFVALVLNLRTEKDIISRLTSTLTGFILSIILFRAGIAKLAQIGKKI